MIGGSTIKPEGAVIEREGVWFKYGVSRYAMYHKDGAWRESAWVTNQNIADWLEGKVADKEPAHYIVDWLEGKVADEEPAHYGSYVLKNDDGLKFRVPETPVAIAVLNQCADLQRERGAEYDKAGQQERSFTRVAQAFNAITGKNLTPAEVCLLLQVLKDVRQWSNPNRLHKDSAIDGVNYGALKVEELFNQFGETL